ncbi:transporter substrate-binding domain-containing protein [Lutibacter sp. B2]|nr:transporter substrate-binding domain-containing protein [Lutibacter sp. B2]
MNKRIVCLLAILVITLLFSYQIVQAEDDYYRHTIVIGGDEYFPPFEYVDKNGTYKGFNVDLMRAIAIEQGIDLEIKPMPWSKVIQELNKGKIHAIQGMKYTLDRTNLYDFSVPYLVSSQSIFVNVNSSYIVDLEDFENKKVAIQKNDIARDVLKKTHNIVIVETENQEKALKKLVAKEVDAYVGNRLTGLYNIQKNGYNKQIKIIGNEINPTNYGIVVKKENKYLLEIFNEGLKTVMENGTYDKIYKKWFGQTIDPSYLFIKKIFNILIVILLIAMIMIMFFYKWNYLLKKEVKKRIEKEKMLIEKMIEKDKLESLGRLVAGIAHEIRNPLTAIKMYIELIPYKYDSISFRQKISEDVPKEIERLDNIISDLLEYAKPKQANKKMINVYKEINDVLIFFENHIDDNHIELYKEMDTDLCIFFDNYQFRQIIINLLLNGIQAVKETKNSNIYIYVRKEGEFLIIIIKDNGCGISMENKTKIFEPFFTTKNTGTGLGLATCYQFIKENEGEIFINSEIGVGTEVKVIVPIF